MVLSQFSFAIDKKWKILGNMYYVSTFKKKVFAF